MKFDLVMDPNHSSYAQLQNALSTAKEEEAALPVQQQDQALVESLDALKDTIGDEAVDDFMAEMENIDIQTLPATAGDHTMT